MKNHLFSFLLGLTLLALNCISCSHNRTISADAGLTDESSTEVSAAESTDSGESTDLSKEVEQKAEDLVGSSDDKAPLEATAAVEPKLGEDPVLLGMESQVMPEDKLQVAQTETQPLDNSVKTAPTVTDSTTSSFGAIPPATVEKKEPVARKPLKKKEHVPSPRVEKAPAEKKVEAPVASNVQDPFADELNAPIPEPDKPKLASAEIGSFIERHAFLVTLCGVAFVFAMFIIMRRKKDHEDHNLSV